MHDSDELDDILNEIRNHKTRTQRMRPQSRSRLRP